MRITAGEGDIKSYMGVPLRSGDEVLGVLAIRNITKSRTFNINDDRILTTVGSQLGAAIQNARLFEQIQNLLKFSKILFKNGLTNLKKNVTVLINSIRLLLNWHVLLIWNNFWNVHSAW